MKVHCVIHHMAYEFDDVEEIYCDKDRADARARELNEKCGYESKNMCYLVEEHELIMPTRYAVLADGVFMTMYADSNDEIKEKVRDIYPGCRCIITTPLTEANIDGMAETYLRRGY